MPAKVAIRRCATYDPETVYRAVGEAVAAATDPAALLRNKHVVLKINLLSDRPPERAVITHPEIVRALIRLCREHGAAEVAVSDMPAMHLTNIAESVFENNGISAICRELGARIAPFSVKGYREVRVPGARRMAKVMAAVELLDAEVVVNVPKLKSHMQSLYTGAVKNWFGTVSNNDRKISHALGGLIPFSESLADIYRVRLPELTVMDAVVGMEGRGPNEGKPKQTGLILASTDGVAVDAVAIACVDYQRLKVPHVRIAAEDGAGEADLEKIIIDGPAVAEVRVPYELPPKLNPSVPKIVMKIAWRLYRIRPKILAAECESCGACAKMCPAGAITMGPESAVIDAGQCIECFCCHEVCPHDAIGEKMTLAYRLHRWFDVRKAARLRRKALP